MRPIIWLSLLLFLLPACGSNMRVNVGASQPLPLVPPISPIETQVPVPSTPQEKPPTLEPEQQRDPAVLDSNELLRPQQRLDADQLRYSNNK